MKRSRWIRPAWTPATTTTMVLGFIVFWPLGLAMLAYILLGRRAEKAKWRVHMPAGYGEYDFGRSKEAFSGRFRNQRDGDLVEDDRKLAGMKEEFDTFLSKLRQSKNRQDFSRFMQKRRQKGNQAIQKA